MTPTHPAPGLVEVLKAAYDEWQSWDEWPVDLFEHQRRAVAAWLARPETVERMVEVFVLERTTQDGIRAAVAAVVGERGGGK